MSRLACVSLFAVLLLAACRDDEPLRSADPVAPEVSVVVEELPLDTSSSVCRAYVREYAAVRAAKDAGVLDVRSRERAAALNTVIADACR